MNITITPGLLRGNITPPPSKSQAHRVIIGAGLSAGRSTVKNVSPSQDITATLSCMEALGAEIRWEGESAVQISGISKKAEPGKLFCGESGSTLRFFIPIALALYGRGEFYGKGRLMERPQEPYFEIFREKGIAFSREGDTLYINGHLTPGEYKLRGDVSSQFITGLLYALPLLPGDSEILLTTPLESAGYIDMTLDALSRFGITAARTARGFFVPGNQTYAPTDTAVEADYSQAAFFYAARGMGNFLEITGMNPDSRQGDRIILSYAEKLDGPGEISLDVRECPDLVPPLAVRAALRDGEITHITNAGRLRLKESDRLQSVTDVLSALGADISEEPEGLTIRGKETLPGGAAVGSWNDHRIAMMAAIAASRCENPVTVMGAECVKKSYPGFWEDYAGLGGKLEEQP